MTTRSPFPASPYSGSAFKTALDGRFKTLFDAASLPLGSVGGTANAVTATLAPVLDGDGLLDGMTFSIAWGAANTGAMTLALNGGSPLPVLGPDGLAMLPAAVGEGLVSSVTYWGGDFILTSPTLLMVAGGATRYSWILTVSGVWTKPAGLAAGTPMFLEAWGGGGGGHTASSGGGGGGGAYASLWARVGDISASVTYSIANGGVAGANGGNTTFGAFLTAYGGERGETNSGGNGGGSSENGAAGGYLGGGQGQIQVGATTEPGTAASTNAGGGGAGHTTGGYRAVYGGGGGAGAAGAGGASTFAGNGGALSVSGSAPAGGGGRNAAGARGEIRIWI